MKDLICLVADKNMESTLQGLINKPERLGIKNINRDIFVHPESDPGCFNTAHHFLRSFSDKYRYGLVLFDYHGSGQETKSSSTEIQVTVEEFLNKNGWDERAKVVVLDPELEIWVWSDSPKVDECLGWRDRVPTLRTWLIKEKLLEENQFKPKDPKKALEETLRLVRKPRSSMLYRQLAEQVSFNRCTDSSFIRLRTILQEWFPLNQ